MKRATTFYLFLNLVGILLFAWFVYRIEALAHAEERHYRDAFDSITFLTTAGPAFLVCAVGSCVWSIRVLVDVMKKRRFESLKALIAVAGAWTATIVSLRFLPL